MKYLRLIASFLLIAASVLVSFYPGIHPAVSEAANFLDSNSQIFLIVLTVVFGLYTLWRARPSSSRSLKFPVFDNIGSSNVSSEKVTGEDFDSMIENGKQDELRGRLKEDAEEVVEQTVKSADVDGSEVVESGDWTENMVAAAFLSSSVNYPLRERFMEWLEEDRTEKRVSETMDALEEEYYRGDSE